MGWELVRGRGAVRQPNCSKGTTRAPQVLLFAPKGGSSPPCHPHPQHEFPTHSHGRVPPLSPTEGGAGAAHGGQVPPRGWVLPGAGLAAPRPHLVLGAGGAAAAPADLLPSAHDGGRGDTDCCKSPRHRAARARTVPQGLGAFWGLPAFGILHPGEEAQGDGGEQGLGAGRAPRPVPSHPTPCTRASPAGPREPQDRKGIQSSEEGGPALTRRRVVSVLWCQAMKEAALARQRCLATAWI